MPRIFNMVGHPFPPFREGATVFPAATQMHPGSFMASETVITDEELAAMKADETAQHWFKPLGLVVIPDISPMSTEDPVPDVGV